MGRGCVGESSMVGYVREGLADVLIDTRYFIEWSNCLPYGPMDFLYLRRYVLV